MNQRLKLKKWWFNRFDDQYNFLKHCIYIVLLCYIGLDLGFVDIIWIQAMNVRSNPSKSGLTKLNQWWFPIISRAYSLRPMTQASTLPLCSRKLPLKFINFPPPPSPPKFLYFFLLDLTWFLFFLPPIICNLFEKVIFWNPFFVFPENNHKNAWNSLIQSLHSIDLFKEEKDEHEAWHHRYGIGGAGLEFS